MRVCASVGVALWVNTVNVFQLDGVQTATPTSSGWIMMTADLPSIIPDFCVVQHSDCTLMRAAAGCRHAIVCSCADSRTFLSAARIFVL